jgi:hypothetical protein
LQSRRQLERPKIRPRTGSLKGENFLVLIWQVFFYSHGLELCACKTWLPIWLEEERRGVTPPYPDEQVVARFDCSFSCQLHTLTGLPFSALQSALHRQAVGEQFRKLLEQSPTRHHQYVASLWAWAVRMVVGLDCLFKLNCAPGNIWKQKIP